MKIVDIDNIAYIGNHGLEIEWKHKKWVHPTALKTQPKVKEICRRIWRRARHLPGVIIEDKGPSGSIHFRLLASHYTSSLRKIIHEEIQISKDLLKLTEGKKVYEIRPRVDWDKGRGILKLLSWLNLNEKPFMIYLGDDQTDEDVFRILRRDNLTIRVGSLRRSLASFKLKNVSAAWQFLTSLERMISTPEQLLGRGSSRGA